MHSGLYVGCVFKTLNKPFHPKRKIYRKSNKYGIEAAAGGLLLLLGEMSPPFAAENEC